MSVTQFFMPYSTYTIVTRRSSDEKDITKMTLAVQSRWPSQGQGYRVY